MVHSGEVESYCVSFFVVPDIVEMATKSFCNGVSCLSHILLVACFASNAIDEI